MIGVLNVQPQNGQACNREARDVGGSVHDFAVSARFAAGPPTARELILIERGTRVDDPAPANAVNEWYYNCWAQNELR